MSQKFCILAQKKGWNKKCPVGDFALIISWVLQTVPRCGWIQNIFEGLNTACNHMKFFGLALVDGIVLYLSIEHCYCSVVLKTCNIFCLSSSSSDLSAQRCFIVCFQIHILDTHKPLGNVSQAHWSFMILVHFFPGEPTKVKSVVWTSPWGTLSRDVHDLDAHQCFNLDVWVTFSTSGHFLWV